MNRYLGFIEGNAFITNEEKQIIHVDLMEPSKSAILNVNKQIYSVHHLDFIKDTGYSYQLYQKCLITINYITNSFDTIEIKELKLLNISVISSELNGHFFVFTAHRDGYSFSSGLVGIFNISTMTLEWIHDFYFETGRFFGAGIPPVLVDDKIYVLDTQNDLHVFGKD